MRFTAPVAVLAGKNSQEYHFSPLFILEFIREIKGRYLKAKNSTGSYVVLDSSPFRETDDGFECNDPFLSKTLSDESSIFSDFDTRNS